MSRTDGRVTIDIIVNGQHVTREIDAVEKGFAHLGRNADEVMKKVGKDMGRNSEAGAKDANKAVDSVDKTVSDLGKTTESATTKAGKSISDNFDAGAKGANQATDSITKGIVALTATTSTELVKSGRIMGESFESGAKSASQSNDSVVKSVASLVSSVESSTPAMGRSIGDSFLAGAKDASSASESIVKSVSNMTGAVEIALPGLGGSISEPFVVGAKQATTSMDVVKKSAAKMVPEVELAATTAGNGLSRHLEVAGKDGARAIADAVAIMKKDLGSLGDAAEQTSSKLSASFQQPKPKANILTGTVGKLSAAMLITKGATKVLSMAKGSLDGAFSRIDTLNNFENTMTRLTGSSEEAAAGMENVRDVVVGTNYMLDSAAQTVQRLVLQNGSLEQSTKSYQIWGDAVAMYGDGAAETMDNVMDAMIQMRATGTVNMAQMDRMVRRGVDPWKIYEDATGMSMQTIRNALRDGEISANEFFDTVEHALREGGNELTSVSGMAQQAGDTWAGSFANMATATSRGTANIITAMDEAFAETRFGSMKENVQGFGKTFEGALNGVAGVIPPVVSAIDTLVGGIVGLTQISPIANGAIIALTAGITGYMLVKKAELYTRGFITSLKTLTGAKTAATAVTKTMIATDKAHLGAVAASKAVLAGSAAGTKAYTLAVAGLTAAKTALKMVINPIGGILTGLAAGAVWLAKKWNDSRKSAKELASELDNLTDDLESVGKSTESSAKEFEAQAKVIESNTERNKDLAAELQRLSEAENQSAADKQMMMDTVEELNNSVAGLNLTYDEETGLLSATTEEINKRIEASKGMDEVSRLSERQNQLSQESAEIEATLKEVAKERAMIEYDAAVSGVDGKKAVKEASEALSAKEEELQELLKNNQAEKEGLYADEMALRKQVAATTTEANRLMIDSYNHLSDTQKESLNSMNEMYKKLVEQSTNAFETIEQNEAISLDKMVDNLKKNAQAMDDWSTNVAKLAERGVDDGLIMQLEKMGPAGAKQAALLVNATDEELKKLNDAMASTTKQALRSTAQIADEETDVVAEKLALIPEKAEISLRTEFEGRDFAQWGKYPVDEVAKGLEEGEEQVAEAAENVAQVPGQVIEETIANTNYAELTDPLAEGTSNGILAGIEPVGDASRELAETPERLFGEVIDQDVFVTHGETPGKGYAEGIDRSKAAVEASAAELSGVPQEVFEKEMDPNRFEPFGTSLGQGLEIGIDKSAPGVEKATKNMAEQANKSFRSVNQINSLSGLYRKYGGNITEGLAQGITRSKDAPVRALTTLVREMQRVMERELSSQKMATTIGREMTTGISNGIDTGRPQVIASVSQMTNQMVREADTGGRNFVRSFTDTTRQVDRALQPLPRMAQATLTILTREFEAGSRQSAQVMNRGAQQIVQSMQSLPNSFQMIGQNAMIGLNNGLVAGSNRVMTTANTIANNVARTMQRALRINSPSKVMELDVGRWIPAGIGEGIERFKHLALDSIESLGNQLVLPRINAEQLAFSGSGGMTLAGSSSQVVENNQTVHHSPQVTIHMHDVSVSRDQDELEELGEQLALETQRALRRDLN